MPRQHLGFRRQGIHNQEDCLTYEDIKRLGGDIVGNYSNSPVSDHWEEFPVSRAKELLAEAEATMREIERNQLPEKWKYQRAQHRRRDIESGFKFFGENSRWFMAVDPQTFREFFAAAKRIDSE
jgi:D-mannonate dehydratase